MTDGQPDGSATVETVLGPVPADDLGVVSVHEALLSVFPGAEYAFDVDMDRSEIFRTLAHRLMDFHDHGGRTIVDSTGMFHGRDLRLYETLSRSTGVHIIASTGMGPEEMLGGYFLTPQTNPPTPWPAERFADLFTREVTEGMVVPRLERRGPAGLVTVAAHPEGMTATEESLLRGAARTSLTTGVPTSLRYGGDALRELDIALDQGLAADRLVVGGLDRKDAVAAGVPLAVARCGTYVALDHVGLEDDTHVTDRERAALVVDLVEAGLGDRILLSSNATGKAVGHPGNDLAYSHVLSTFVPLLRASGLHDEDIERVLVANPRDLLTRR
ncbi:MAG TPA: phosphotriesterase [Nocardiopsis listeri]|uniref:phosphotriesterase family protein n=1 Tax=Nocardiopsis listeri TaxID=53440 RepID=UPI001D2CE801|nr:phosphotriesterase [Nocardiopsis listeri]HJE58319.1 phosphotriesterase [Nocardiopsis listeri]